MLSEFPTEILVKILSFLPLKDVLHLSCTSSKFCDALALVYTRRRNHIRGQYSSLHTGSPLSFAEVRHLLLSHYGFTVGLWKVVSTPYGGLVEVKFDGYQLVGTCFFPPPDPHLDQQLRAKKIFIINIDNEGNCECICFKGHRGPHRADVCQFESDGFQLDCKNSEMHQHPEGPSKDFALWLKEELGVETVNETHHTDLLTSKYDSLSQEVSLRCSPLHLPPSRESAVIQPGLFKGTYSSHGLELVMLAYNDEDNSAVLTKITGDPNIPAGKVTIVADLKAPIDAETQEAVVGQDDPGPEQGVAFVPSLQRFRLPSFITSRQETVPEFFQYKFSSKGQVAASGYVDSTFIPGQWVIFDRDTFGHIWLYLAAFAMFKRVTENFCT